ncbi:MAG: CaiB/BaiF CoA-transferase family protein [Acidobacteriota bacterium]
MHRRHDPETAAGPRPLDGVRVLELGQLMAGPFAGTLLAYYGAEVIKVEPPGQGDPVRTWRVLDDDGTSMWWRSLGRNKRCVTADLRREEGRVLVRRLAAHCDVVVENFRPGTVERWGLGPDDLGADRPDLIYARASGYGQTGPYAEKAGFASVCEGFGGLRHVTGFPGGPPVRSNLSLGDSLCGFHTAFGILLALIQRGKPTGRGQVVDVAIFESVYNMMEAVVPEYDRAGAVRGPSGTTITGIVPTNTYPCRDGKHVIIGGTGDSVFKRLMRAAGRLDLADDPRLATNDGRVAHQGEVDDALGAWTRTLPSADVLRILDDAAVPAGPIYSVEDMVEDPQYQARGLFEEVEVGGRPMKLPAIVPKLTETPGRTEWPGPELGAHTNEVFRELLGLDDGELHDLRSRGVI